MKQKTILFFLVLNFFNSVFPDVYGRSYFSVTSLFRPTMPEMVTVMHDKVEDEYPRNKIDMVALGSVSTNELDLAKYFLPNGSSEIIAAGFGTETTKAEKADVISNYFNVLTSPALTPATPADPIDTLFENYKFESKLTFRPKQKMFGFAFRYRRHLSEFTNKDFWFDVTIPIVHVRNDLGMEEEIISSGGSTGKNPVVPKGYVGNMKAAFKQPGWFYGKIDGVQKKTGVADIYLRLGFDYVKEPTHHLASFVGVVIPTGNTPCSEYLWEPIVGNGGHFGGFFGASAGFRIWCKGCSSIYWRLDTVGIGWAENTQFRSFDLKGKPWSRYMWVYLNNKSEGVQPGINTFSEAVRVNPGPTRDLNTAFVFSSRRIKAEIGYHFLAKQSEGVKLAACWNEGPAIAAITEPATGVNSKVIEKGKSRNHATIDRYARVPNDMTAGGAETYKPLKESDFDLESASHPSTISHTAYGDVGYSFGKCLDKYVKLGAAYEFTSDNTSLARWYLWLRFGVDF